MKRFPVLVALGLWLCPPTLGYRHDKLASQSSLRFGASLENASVAELRGEAVSALPHGDELKEFKSADVKAPDDGHGPVKAHDDGHGQDDGHGDGDAHGQGDGHGDGDAHGHGDGHGDGGHSEDHGDHGDKAGHEDAHGHDGGHSEDNGHGHDAGHGDGHGHEHHAVYDPMAAALAKVLFATVSFVMVLFYFVNHKDHDVVEATWVTLSNMVSIFVAVLMFSSTTTALFDFAEADAHHRGPPPMKNLIISFVRYVMLVVSLEFVFIFCQKRPWMFKYLVCIGSHIVGFGALDAYGSALQLEIFSTSLAMTWLGVVVFSVAIAAVPLAIAAFREKEHGTEHWKEECFEYQVEYVGLAIGLLVSLAIRFSISGELPPVHGSPRSKTMFMVWALLSVSVLMIPLMMALAVAKARLHEQHVSHAVVRVVETVQQSVSMTMGWTLMYWGFWQFYAVTGDKDEDFGPGGKMSQRITMAIIFSMLVFCSIIAIDCIADRLYQSPALQLACRDLLKTFSLLMGLSWEACFNEAVHAIGLKYSGRDQTMVIVGLSLATCAVVVPAWASYILPHTVSDHFGSHFTGNHETEHGDNPLVDRHKQLHRSSSLFVDQTR